jgi:hypothetical protein
VVPAPDPRRLTPDRAVDGLHDFQQGDPPGGPGQAEAAPQPEFGAEDAGPDQRRQRLEEEAPGQALRLRDRVRGDPAAPLVPGQVRQGLEGVAVGPGQLPRLPVLGVIRRDGPIVGGLQGGCKREGRRDGVDFPRAGGGGWPLPPDAGMPRRTGLAAAAGGRITTGR